MKTSTHKLSFWNSQLLTKFSIANYFVDVNSKLSFKLFH